MKRARALLVVAGCSLLAAQCARRDENAVLSKLPELPRELAAELEPARTAPVLMAQPKLAPPPGPQTPPPLVKVASSCTSNFAGFMVFPVTVCYPVGGLVEQVHLSGSATEAARSAAARPRQEVKYYRLSSFTGLSGPFLCSTRGGPWSAEAKETQDCNGQLSTTLTITTPGDDVAFLWHDRFTNPPPEFHLNTLGNLSLEGPATCSCCAGFKDCDGSCIPEDAPCSHNPA